MTPIQCANDLERACMQPRVLLFLWVDWSVQAHQSKSVIERLVERWETDCPKMPLASYVADLSTQNGEVWEKVRAWLEAVGRPVDQLCYGGVGSLLWLRNGEILAHAIAAGTREVHKLFETSRSLYGTDA